MRKLIIAAGVAACVASPTIAGTWIIEPESGNRVVFVSKAPTETFEGTTDRISGTVTLDPADIGDSVTVHLEIDMASFDTGKEKRNRHMRERHLETDRYPTAVFEGLTVLEPRGAALEAGQKVTFEVEGTLDLHGVKRRLRATVDVTRTSDGALLIEARFPVTLADYEISRPRFLFLKLGETQQVTVTATARPR